MVRFEYVEPTSLSEATGILAGNRGQAKVLAGGTDLLKHLKDRTLKPRFLVNIKRIPGLEGIVYTPGRGLSIGALTTMDTLERSSLLQERYPALSQASHSLGSPQVRNLATIGGNVCNAAPSAETAPSLITFSASARIMGFQGERTMPLESFFTGPGTTVLQDGELLTEILLPDATAAMGSAYIKHCPRGAVDVAIVGVAAMVRLSSDGGAVEECRIGLGAVAPTPLRAKRAEALLQGEKPTDRLVQVVAEKAAEECSPVSDIRGSAEYRRRMVAVLTARALGMAIERAHSRGIKRR